MEEPQRVISAKNSRRRRWDVKSRESFEAALAVETESPQENQFNEKSESRSKYMEPKPHADSRDIINGERMNVEQLRQNRKSSVKSVNSKPNSEQMNGEQLRQNTKSSVKAVSSKPDPAKSSLSRPVSGRSSNSKPSSAKPKRTSTSNTAKGDEPASDSDLLSEKLGALLDDASLKGKDPKKQITKLKGGGNKESQKHISKQKEHQVLFKDDVENSDYKSPEKEEAVDMKISRVELTKDTETPSFNPSAPPLSPSTEKVTKVKKHKRKSESKILLLNTLNEESFIALQLKEMKDDVIDITKDDGETVIAAPGLFQATAYPTVNGNINAIFEEKIGGFVKAGNDISAIQKLSERLHDVAQVQTRTSHAVSLQTGFRTFSVLCQGLLAGITVTHCLLIFLLEPKPQALPGLYHAEMAQVFYALIMFLTLVCFVSSCDRYDLSGVGLLTGHGIKVPWTPAFYLTSLVLSLVATRTEDVLTHQILYQEALSSEKETELVDWWRWICVARSSAAVLGWLAVVPDPHTDALLDSIQELNNK